LLHSVVSQEFHGLVYIMCALLFYLVLTPIFVYNDRKRTILFALLLIVLSYFYWEYEDIDPFVFSLQLIPLSLCLAILFGGTGLAVFTWMIGNISSYIILHNDLLPALLGSTVVIVSGFYFAKHITRCSFHLKYIYATSMFIVYQGIYLIINADLSRYDHLYVLYTTILSYVSIWFMTFILFHVKKQEIHKEKLLSLDKNRMIGQLAASVSHEIRNPLTTTRGFLQLLDQKECSIKDRKRYMSLALSGIDQADAIITDYLNFAKPDSIQQEQLDIKEEVDTLIQFISPVANESRVAVHITHDSDFPLYVMGESKKLRQCFINLIKNAIESMPHGGSLIVNTCKLEDTVQISISDTGVGMSKAQMKKLGMPFYTTKEQGTGLGIVVVMSIIRMMNGKISYSSNINKGTLCLIQFQHS
jgi:two-component system, sporulation sensor kinase B